MGLVDSSGLLDFSFKAKRGRFNVLPSGGSFQASFKGSLVPLGFRVWGLGFRSCRGSFEGPQDSFKGSLQGFLKAVLAGFVGSGVGGFRAPQICGLGLRL